MTGFLPVTFVAIAAFAYPAHASAETLHGRVIKVADGDTVTVLDSGMREWKIRLAGIDAPEKAQPFGQVSKRSLEAMVAGKPVEVEWDKRDRYGRVVGKVLVSGRDAGLAQVDGGMAWWYRKYAGEQPAADQRRYAEAEVTAQELRSGLWRDADPVPPWEWRKAKRDR